MKHESASRGCKSVVVARARRRGLPIVGAGRLLYIPALQS